MAPAPQEAGTFGIEKDNEGFGEGIDLNAVAGLPLCRRWTGAMVGILDQASESRILHVDDPRAVARLDDDLIHRI
jgi:hypothetical protein